MVNETKKSEGARPRRVKSSDIVTRDYTVHLSKRLYGATFKNRAPSAVRVVKAFASKAMKTSDVRIGPDVNKALWANGIKNVPKRIRIRLSRKRNENEDAKEKLYTVVNWVNVPTFKGLETENVN